MDYNVRSKITSSQERASKAFKGNVRSPDRYQSQKFQDTQISGTEFGRRPYIEWNHGSREDADDVPGIHQKYRGRHHKKESVNDIKMDDDIKKDADDVPGIHQKYRGRHHKKESVNNIKKDDELVKHMSGLPGYLQQMERGDNKQGKVLNFGVLDWKRLEKWNNNEGLVPSRCYKTSSSSDCNSSFMVSGSSTISGKQHPGRKGYQSHGKVAKPRGFETAPWSNVDRKRNLHMKDKSSGELFSEFSLDREKRKESDNWFKSAKEHSLVHRSENVLPTSSHVTKSDQDFEINTAVNKKVDIPRKSIEHENIVLLLPKSSPNKHGSKSVQLPPSRTAMDENSSEAHSNLGCFSPEQELHYLDLYSKIPHSCPLSCSVADTVESDMEKCSSANVKLHFNKSGLHQRPKEEPIVPLYRKCQELNSLSLDPSIKTPLRLDQRISVKPVIPDKHVNCSSKSMARDPIFKESSSVQQSKFSYSTLQYGPVGVGNFAGSDIVSQHSISDNDRATTSTSTTTDTPKRLDQNISEQPDTMNRHPSPSPQLTFSRMTRSLSFKDGTSLPPLSSLSAKVKSGPLSSEGFCDFDNFDRHHVGAGYRAPLSPLSKSEIPTRSIKDTFEKPGTILGRHPSPSRFSFSRIARSFSFKEVPSVPHLSSSCATNSRPLRTEAPDGLGELNHDNLCVANRATADTPKRVDENIGKQPAAAGRHPSPSRRFSFSNPRRISKSLDFKEIASGPQLSSHTTSQSAGLNSSVGRDKFNQDNVSASNRARSSPLRRLLDPLLKPRVVVNSADTVKVSKENLTSVSLKPITANELLQSQRQKTPNVQALLQLTRKNGLPLFRLVVDSSSDILVAAVKQLPTPGDDASSLIYALYSVHEVKNKNEGWMSKGSRGKQPNFSYNTIGQMRIFNSCPPGYCAENIKDQYVSRESILYGVETEQGNKETPEFMLSKELAAVAIKNVYQNEKQGKKDNMCSREGITEQFLENTCNGRENENSNSTTVILGGVHGLPDKVIPSSSLIWRYGGSCDCGGWDVGCKLRILTTQDQKRNSGPLISCSTGLDLFFEGGEQEKKPSFSLAPFKTGVYSVEFDSSISLLQSFFISIAFLSSHRLHEIFDGVFDTKNFTAPKIDKMKFPTMVSADIPAKYVTKPPPSPVGRV